VNTADCDAAFACLAFELKPVQVEVSLVAVEREAVVLVQVADGRPELVRVHPQPHVGRGLLSDLPQTLDAAQ